MTGYFRRPGRTVRRLCVTLAALLPAVANAGMPVERGDVLRITIAEAPSLSREEAKVGADGAVMLPVIGAVPVAGSDLDSIRGAVEAAVIGRDLVRTPTVLVEVVRYRPIYIGGTVATQGAVQFEPGMTVRHAIILAGGVDRKRDQDQVTTPELLKLKADWRGNAYELFTVNTAIARLQAQLARGAPPRFDAVEAPFVDPADKTDIVAIDGAIFDSQMTQQFKQQAHFKDLLTLFDLEIETLTHQAGLQDNERTLQNDQVDKAKVLYEKGLMPLPRLQDLQRESSRLTRELLESQAYAARARQGKETQRFAEEIADSEWEVKVRDELRESILRRKQLEASTEVLAASLLEAGIALSDDASLANVEPEVTIHRDGTNDASATEATLSTELQPGDVLEVSIRKNVPQG